MSRSKDSRGEIAILLRTSVHLPRVSQHGPGYCDLLQEAVYVSADIVPRIFTRLTPDEPEGQQDMAHLSFLLHP